MFFSLLISRALFAADIGTVVIDPGHGGYEGGLKIGRRSEKDVALDVAREVERLLRESQIKVALTRKGDQRLGLKDRGVYANRLGAGVFLSIHLTRSDTFNVYMDAYIEGEGELLLKDYYALRSRQRKHIPESGVLAEAIENAIKNAYGQNVRRIEMSLPLLDYIAAPAVLVEVPYGALSGGDYMADMAKAAAAIASGVLDYGSRQ